MDKKGDVSGFILLFIILLIFVLFALILYYAAVQEIIREAIGKLFQK